MDRIIYHMGVQVEKQTPCAESRKAVPVVQRCIHPSPAGVARQVPLTLASPKGEPPVSQAPHYRGEEGMVSYAGVSVSFQAVPFGQTQRCLTAPPYGARAAGFESLLFSLN